jgi:phasin
MPRIPEADDGYSASMLPIGVRIRDGSACAGMAPFVLYLVVYLKKCTWTPVSAMRMQALSSLAVDLHARVRISFLRLRCRTSVANTQQSRINQRCCTATWQFRLDSAGALFLIFKRQIMQYTPQFEIPSTVRDMAGTSVEQARDVYGRLVEGARQAQDMVSKSTAMFTSGAKEVNDKLFAFGESNVKAGFEMASRLAKARDINEVLEIQTSFARGQMEACTQQAQELSRIITTAAQKAQPIAA